MINNKNQIKNSELVILYLNQNELKLFIIIFRGYLSKKILKCLFTSVLFQFTFPNCDDVPSHFFQLLLIVLITFSVSVELLLPVINIGFWHLGILTPFMQMPETSMNKNNSIIFRQDNIRTSRVSPIIFSKPKSSWEEITSNKNLRFGVLSPNPWHDITSCLFSEFVRHKITCIQNLALTPAWTYSNHEGNRSFLLYFYH